MPPRPPRPTLFPYTTLFRSMCHVQHRTKLPCKGSGIYESRLGGLRKVCGKEYVADFNAGAGFGNCQDRKSTRLNSSHVSISYAVFCLKKKKTTKTKINKHTK